MHHPRHASLHADARSCSPSLLVVLVVCAPDLAMAQASPFMTGATSLQTNILAWLTPVAIILVMVLGGMAMANRMSWGWCIGAILASRSRSARRRSSRGFAECSAYRRARERTQCRT